MRFVILAGAIGALVRLMAAASEAAVMPAIDPGPVVIPPPNIVYVDRRCGAEGPGRSVRGHCGVKPRALSPRRSDAKAHAEP